MPPLSLSFATLLTLAVSASAIAGEKLACRATPWPFKAVAEGRPLSKDERAKLAKHLRKLPRQYAYEYLLSEVTAATPRRNLSLELATYLRGTAIDPKWELFVRLIVRQAGLQDPDGPYPLELAEICEAHDKVQKSDWTPEE